jgi:type VII secretion protein EccB
VSTKRDLVEAHSFSRRRLVTAFVSGAPGGREVEPTRPGRAIVGGLALAVLLVAGAAIAGIFSPRTPEGWRDKGIVIAKETGNNYVVLEDEGPLLPTDPISARLIYGSAPEEVQSVPQDEINKVEIGDDVGIYGAPDNLPSTGLLVDTGWTACMNDSGGAQFRIDREPDVRAAPGSAVTVEGGDGGRWLVASAVDGSGAYRLALGSGRTANGILARLGLGSAPEYAVPDEWLNLFRSGPSLTTASFGVSGGGAAPYAGSLGDASLRIGDLVSYAGTSYVLDEDAPVEVTPFAAAVYEVVAGREPKQIDTFEARPRKAAALAAWPGPAPVALAAEPCALLDAGTGRAARTQLATSPGGEADAGGVGEAIRFSVAPGQGAFVRTAGHGDRSGGQRWVVDAGGTRYRLGGKGAETAGLLGYGSHDPPTIPDAWIEQFACGPELSARAALGSPDAERATSSCDA